MTTSAPDLVTLRPQAVAPTLGWALRRAAIGLIMLAAFTTLAAYLAYASIETSAEPAAAPSLLNIGAPASHLLKGE